MRISPHLLINIPRRIHLLRTLPLTAMKTGPLLRSRIRMPTKTPTMILELDPSSPTYSNLLTNFYKWLFTFFAGMAQVYSSYFSGDILPVLCVGLGTHWAKVMYNLLYYNNRQDRYE